MPFLFLYGECPSLVAKRVHAGLKSGTRCFSVNLCGNHRKQASTYVLKSRLMGMWWFVFVAKVIEKEDVASAQLASRLKGMKAISRNLTIRVHCNTCVVRRTH